jgi:small subunit ribosomal protein S13
MLKTSNLKKFTTYNKIYNLYGVGKNTMTNLYLTLGINNKTRPKSFKTQKTNLIHIYSKKKLIGPALQAKVSSCIKHLYKIRSCKGIRHKKKYPIRGQRTHTNAKTVKRMKSI